LLGLAALVLLIAFRESGQPNAGAASSANGKWACAWRWSDERPIDPAIAGGKPASCLAGALLGAQLAHVLTRLLVSSIARKALLFLWT